MNRRLLVIATTLVAVLWGGALAQDDSLLQRYDLAIENLEVAVASVPSDGVQARDELERALNALLTMSTNATSANLVQAMERTFERARFAIENQSHTDVAVQSAVLAGGFARLVMDSAFTAAANGELDVARARLLHLADDLGFNAAARQALSDAGSTIALRMAFEAGAAESIAARVQEAQGQLTEDQSAAYESLASAYGRSLLVQDSPRASQQLNDSLAAAASALVALDLEAVEEALRQANLELVALADAARGNAPGTPSDGGRVAAVPDDLPAMDGVAGAEAPAGSGTEPGAAAPGTEPSATAPGAASSDPTATAPAGSEPAPADPATAIAEPEEPAPQTPSSDEQADTPATDAAQPPLAGGPDADGALQQRLESAEAERRMQAEAVISRELVLAGIPAQVAGADAQRLLDAGYDSVDEAVTELEALAARAVAAQRGGNVAGARSVLAQLSDSFQGAVAPIVRSVDPSLAADTEALLQDVRQRGDLRSHDVTLVAAQTGALRNALLGGPAVAGQELEVNVDGFWSATTRPIVMIVLGILAVIPLVLLNLAFGGSNRNWRLVGWSLFLLLVPVFYEAIAALGGLVGRFVDQPWLSALSSWSMFSSTTGQAVWALLVLAALLLAIFGLYGICVQFGLLGSGRQRPVAAPATESRNPTGGNTIDWDEEF